MMKGLELAREYYEEFGKSMLERDFPELLPYVAVGLTGSGSECFGFDDEVSRDHDFEPGFCIFLPGEDLVDRRQEFRLSRAYAKLPREYMGLERQTVSPVGGSRHGVLRIGEFYEKAVGAADGMLSAEAWLHIPDYALAEAVNGEIWRDDLGQVTAIRAALRQMPEDVWRKRLAGNLLLMGQSGQYNFVRCIRHQEPEAAQLACVEFVQAAMRTYFLLQRRYMPYYKWSFRALRQLPGGEAPAEKLSCLLKGDNGDFEAALEKYDIMETVAAETVAALKEQGLTRTDCGDLEKHAYSVNDGIRDGGLRNLHVLAGV